MVQWWQQIGDCQSLKKLALVLILAVVYNEGWRWQEDGKTSCFQTCQLPVCTGSSIHWTLETFANGLHKNKPTAFLFVLHFHSAQHRRLTRVALYCLRLWCSNETSFTYQSQSSSMSCKHILYY